ncbi:hypothetical protein [Xanthomonas phage BUDD]|nr:hypothetical protein [Xanthomonas phage BUDD]
MAKIGIEVEGMLRGENVRTYFCSAREYVNTPSVEMLYTLFANNIDMIYISDHHNELNLEHLAAVFEDSGIGVTVELTELTAMAPAGVEIFWNVSQASYAQSRTLHFLRPHDQIKIENEKHVLAFVAGNAVITYPEDFNGDIEV